MDDFVITGISRAAAVVSLEAGHQVVPVIELGFSDLVLDQCFRNHLLGLFELFLLILKFRTDSHDTKRYFNSW